MTCASKSVVHKTVGRRVEGQGHLVLLWKRVSSGARNLNQYVLVISFLPTQAQAKRSAGCMSIFGIARSQEKKLLLASAGCSVPAFMLLVAVFDSLALSVSCDRLWRRSDYSSDEHLSFCRCAGSEREIPGASYPEGIAVVVHWNLRQDRLSPTS